MQTSNSIDPAAFDIVSAAHIMGVGRSTVFAEIAEGRLEAKKAGRKTLITRAAIQAWLDQLPVRARRTAA